MTNVCSCKQVQLSRFSTSVFSHLSRKDLIEPWICLAHRSYCFIASLCFHLIGRTRHGFTVKSRKCDGKCSSSKHTPPTCSFDLNLCTSFPSLPNNGARSVHPHISKVRQNEAEKSSQHCNRWTSCC